MKLRGITRDELAATSGYSTGVISNIRKGHDFNTEQLLVLCQILDVSPNYIFGFSAETAEIEMITSSLNRLKNHKLNSLIIGAINLIDK